MTTLASRLEALMRSHGFKSQSQLARRADLPQSTIHRILQRPDYSPSMASLRKLAGAFGVSMTWLAEGKGPVRTELREPAARYEEPGGLTGTTDVRLSEAMSILERLSDTERGHVLAVLRLIGRT